MPSFGKEGPALVGLIAFAVRRQEPVQDFRGKQEDVKSIQGLLKIYGEVNKHQAPLS